MDPIAVIGVSIRAPKADNAKELWNILIQGRDVVGPVPPTRWNDNKETKGGFLNQSPQDFDADFFCIKPHMAKYIDPQVRILLEASWEALEDAGVRPDTLMDTTTGIYSGAWQIGYLPLVESSPDYAFLRSYWGNSVGSGAAQLAFFLGTNGPCVSNESGCSTSVVSIHQAVKALRDGDCYMAICGGVNLLVRPFDRSMMEHVLSKRGKCMTFDDAADGFCRAEGCGVIILKKYSDALKDGDAIHALILGTGISYDGGSRSMGTPTVSGESMCINAALTNAGVSPADIVFLEAHGTGTPVGDSVELGSIYRCYSGVSRKQDLIVASSKANIGHTESASGIIGLLKLILVMKNNIIPKQINFNKWNSSVAQEIRSNIKIPVQNTPLPKLEGKARLTAVSSFGITGVNGHVIMQEVEEPNSTPKESFPSRPISVLKITAKTKEALNALTLRWIDYVQDSELLANSLIQMEDIFFTANTSRMDWPWRKIILAKDLKETAHQLCKEQDTVFYVANGKPEGLLCFLFPGQGCQHLRMCQELYETSPVFQRVIDECADILETRHSFPLIKVLWDPKCEFIHHTLYSQTALFCVEYALFRLWTSWGLIPDVVLGHSSGEFAAAVAADLLTMPDALKILVERSRFINELPTGIMLAITKGETQVKELLKEARALLDIAAINGPSQTVVAGTEKEVEKLEMLLKQRQIRCTRLKTNHAYHSRMLEPMLHNFEKSLRDANWKIPEDGGALVTPLYISSLEGKIVTLDQIAVPDYWLRQIRQPVQFQSACKALAELGVSTCVEIGPQPILSSLLDFNLPNPPNSYPSLQRGRPDWDILLKALADVYLRGYSVDWTRFEEGRTRHKIHGLPTYPFSRTPHWIRRQTGNDLISQQDHPFLGTYFSGVDNNHYFVNPELNHDKLPYLADHRLGEHILFPGSAMIETCFAAAKQVGIQQKLPKTTTLTLIDFQIRAPLPLPNPIQTLVSKTGDKFKVQLASRCMGDTAPTWRSHVEAAVLFTTYPTTDVMKGKLSSIFTCLKKQSPKDASFFYAALEKVGYNYGKCFCSITTLWTSNDDDVIAKVMNFAPPRGYIIHPVILDAAFQLAAFLVGINPTSRKVLLPTKLHSITVHNTEMMPEEEDSCILRTWREGGQYNGLIATTSGQLMATFESIEFTETTLPQLDSVLKEQQYPTPHALHTRFERLDDKPKNSIINLTQVLSLPSCLEGPNPGEQLSEADRITQNQLEKVAELFIEEFLQNQGYTQNNMSLYEFMGKNKFLPNFRRLVKFFINVEKNIGENTTTIEQLVSSLQISGVKKLLPLFLHLRQNLSEILKGNQDVLTIFFPSIERQPTTNFSADIYYQHHPGYRFFLRETIFQIQDVIKKHLKKNVLSQPIRILEVGSGTCMLTALLLPVLKDLLQLDFELWITDVSEVFLQKAEAKFMEFAPCVKFALFDMESGPMEQGIPPHYFDIAVAFEVLHVSLDLEITLENIWTTLTPGGVFILGETVIQSRETTLSFGLLPGYWRFEDAERVKNNHCCMSINQWQNLLYKEMFSTVVATTAYDKRFACILSSKPTDSIPKKIRGGVPSPPQWLLLLEHNDCIMHKVAQELSTTSCLLVQYRSKPTGSSSGILRNEFLESTTRVTFSYGNLAKILDLHSRSLAGIIYAWVPKGPEDGVSDSVEFAEVAKWLLQHKGKLPSIYVITPGIFPMGEHEPVVTPTAGLLAGLCRSLKNECPSLKLLCLDVSAEINSEQEEQLIVTQLYNLICLGQQQYHQHCKEHYLQFTVRGRAGCFGAKLTKLNLLGNYTECLIPPGVDKYYLSLADSELGTDYTLVPMTFDPASLEEDMVEVQVHSYGLNFRDVLRTLLDVKDAGGSMQFEKFINEYAGIVTQCGRKVENLKVGDRVFGIGLQLTQLPSYLNIDSQMALRMPDKLSFCEAVTLPVAFATAYECVMKVAKLQEGETVLVHAASGALGLVLIQLAKTCKARIIATAGTPRKRAFLRMAVAIDHVFESRSTSFGKEILNVTGGKGVDVVFNSLTGEGQIDASLKCCANNARFIEVGKYNIWTAEQVCAIRPDVTYTIVDLLQSSKKQWLEYNQQMLSHLSLGSLCPLPYVSFDITKIKHAMKYFQDAKHLGKIVVTLPTSGKSKDGLSQLFNLTGAYLITGGLGGIGIKLTEWMVEHGAKHIYLMSRNPPTDAALQTIASMNSCGANIKTVSADVSDFEQCEKTIKEIMLSSEHGPLRGIMHCAGALDDAPFMDITANHFKTTYDPKLVGTWNLHKVTQSINLEHFVLHSSGSALFGIRGQPNHSAANSYLDAFAHWRRTQGLPAISVNWGQWSQVGSAIHIDVGGVLPTSTRRMLQGLAKVMKANLTQVFLGDLSPFSKLEAFMPITKYVLDKTFLEDTPEIPSGSALDQQASAPSLWTRLQACASDTDKELAVTEFLQDRVRVMFRMRPQETVSITTTLADMGMESLMVREFRNLVQAKLGKELFLDANAMQGSSTIKQLTTIILGTAEGKPKLQIAKENDYFNHDSLHKLLLSDVQLPDTIKELAATAKVACSPNDVQVVLILGATGFLGKCFTKMLMSSELCPRIKKIYCLCRKPVSSETFSITTSRKVLRVIKGDLTRPQLGMDKKIYQDLCGEVDYVFNFSVKAHHMEDYNSEGTTSVRSTNVLGTHRLLEFCATHKRKGVFYASSFAAPGKVEEKTQWPEEAALEWVARNNAPGYVTSKLVSELCLKHASKLGIPSRCIRYPLIGGYISNGELPWESNHFILRLLTYLELGVILEPEFNVPLDIIPVDVCADIALKCFLRATLKDGVYLLHHPACKNEADFIGLAASEFGVALKPVSDKQFCKLLQEKKTPLQPFIEFYENILTLQPEVETLGGGAKQTSVFEEELKGLPCPLQTIKDSLLYVKRELLHKKERDS